MHGEKTRTITLRSKDVLRKVVPNFLLRERGVVLRLGPQAGRIYAVLRVLDVLGVRTANERLAPPTARSFVFVCFGNIMRSAMAEFLMRKALSDIVEEKEQVRIMSAGLHATAGREAHPWAQVAAADLGVSLEAHRAKPLTPSMVEQADCILAMDFQNKAELLALYPQARGKIYMLSAYAEGPWRYREIPDPYLGDIEITRFCCRQLQVCVHNLITSTVTAAHSMTRQVAIRD